MRIKRKYRVIFFIFITFLCHSSYSQQNELRYFPEVQSDIHLSNVSFSTKDSLTIVGADEKLFYLDGNHFREFEPRIPLRNAFIWDVKAISKNNIWVFYQNTSYDYYTRCYHFDGNKWERIHLSQSHMLQYFSFFDENKFLAGGMWGSLIYFDGKKSHNIKTLSYSYGAIIQAFSSDKYFITMKPEENKNIYRLYFVENGKYLLIAEFESDIISLNFTDPQNGFFILQNGNIYQYRNKKVKLINTISAQAIYSNSHNKTIYFSNTNGVWEFANNKKKRICDNDSYIYLYNNNNDFFFVKNYYNLFYFGSKKMGIKIDRAKTYFEMANYSYQTFGDYGLALYRNDNKKVQAYFTDYQDVNHFFELSKTTSPLTPLEFKDKLLQSNLLGYGSDLDFTYKKRPFYDSGMFFNDIDNDGDADAVMTSLIGCGKIYENEGDDTFTDVTDIYGFKLKGRTKNVFWNDLNNDGLIDIIISPGSKPLFILLNKGNWNFDNKTGKGIIPDSLIGLTPTFADVDNDGDRDLFLYSIYDHIYYFENQTEMKKNAKIKFVDKSFISPGLTTQFDFFPFWLTFGDYDNDGDLDLFLANRAKSIKLFENNGKGVFTDVTNIKIPNRRFLGYSANWGDFDQDGYQDLFLATVGRNYILWNEQADYFRLDSLCFKVNEYSVTGTSVVNDVDNDGDLDIVITNSDLGYSKILLNTINKKNYLIFRFPFTHSTGTKVLLYENTSTTKKKFIGIREIELSQGYFGSGLPEAHFGVDSTKNYSAVIKYPTGVIKNIENIIPGRILEISEPQNKLERFLSNIFSYFLNIRKRIIFWNTLVLILTLIVLTLLAVKKYYWRNVYLVFFYTTVFLSFFLIIFITGMSQFQFKFYIRIYGTLLVTFISFILVNRYSKLYDRESRHFELFDLVRQFNHSVSGFKFIDHVLHLLNNPKYGDVNWGKKLIKELSFFNEQTIPMLKKLDKHYAQLYHEKEFSGDLFFIKRLGNKILLKSSITEYKTKKLKKSFIDLKNKFIKVKVKIEKEYSCDLIKALSLAASRFSQFGELNIQNNMENKEIKVIIKENDLVHVASNIYQNAIDAMENMKIKKLEIIISRKNISNINIIIRDFGIGLKQTKSKQWFNANYSGKNSTGLGLYHAKKIINSYGGTIELRNAEIGNGAIVEISLKEYYETNNNNN